MIDHLVYGVADLDAAVVDLARRLGVEPAYGGRHPGRGTHNALLGLGHRSYLEVIAPDPTQPDPTREQLRYALAFDMVPAIVGWAVAVTDPAELDVRIIRARELGLDLGTPQTMKRQTSDGTELVWRRTPNDPFPLPFLLDWSDSPHPSATAPAGVRLGAVVLTHPDPDRVAQQLRALGAEGLAEPMSGPEVSVSAELIGPAGTVTL